MPLPECNAIEEPFKDRRYDTVCCIPSLLTTSPLPTTTNSKQ
jgi:hypothetical protein